MVTSPSSSTQLTLFTMIHPSTSSSEARPVKPSPSQDSGQGLPTLAVASRWSSSSWSAHFAQSGWSGKTSPVSCRRTEDGRLEPSSGHWLKAGMGGPTESWTLNMSEWTDTLVPCLSDAGVSSLSDVLEETSAVPRRFYLSQRAREGILRRAENRGKALPPMLVAALSGSMGTTIK